MLPGHVILKLLPVLLYNQSLLTHWLVAHVVQNLIKPLIMLLGEISRHLLLMNKGTSIAMFIRA